MWELQKCKSLITFGMWNWTFSWWWWWCEIWKMWLLKWLLKMWCQHETFEMTFENVMWHLTLNRLKTWCQFETWTLPWKWILMQKSFFVFYFWETFQFVNLPLMMQLSICTFDFHNGRCEELGCGVMVDFFYFLQTCLRFLFNLFNEYTAQL